jgi:uncharacterized protein YbjT (DUF2867 family)
MSAAKPTILLIGATGLVGEAVLRHAPYPISYVARRPAEAGKLHHHMIAPPDEWPNLIAQLRPQIVLSALGTTMKIAGSKAAFRAVDHDLVLAAAWAAKAGGARHMISVSSVGAKSSSRNFYLRTKGEVEDQLCAMGFDRVDLLRPGLLMGERAGPERAGEGLAAKLAPLTDPLMVGPLAAYRSISGDRVARAMLKLAMQSETGHFVHPSHKIHALAD